jgi:hypothetical protein
MGAIESHSLWRCNQCRYAVYEVLYVMDSFVYYREYGRDRGKREFIKHAQLWCLEFEELTPDEAIEVMGGGIF